MLFTKFNCNGCGACCRSVGHLAPFLASVDGVCVDLDTDTNRCKIYDDRPLICRVDDFYLEHLTSEMSMGEWYELNATACKELKEKSESELPLS